MLMTIDSLADWVSAVKAGAATAYYYAQLSLGLVLGVAGAGAQRGEGGEENVL